MKEIGDMKLYDFEELLEEDFGPIGTPERDEFEESVDKYVRAYKQRMLNFGMEDDENLDDILLKYKEHFYEGFKIGVLIAKKNVAKKLLYDGFSVEIVERLTTLPKEDILNLLRNQA